LDPAANTAWQLQPATPRIRNGFDPASLKPEKGSGKPGGLRGKPILLPGKSRGR